MSLEKDVQGTIFGDYDPNVGAVPRYEALRKQATMQYWANAYRLLHNSEVAFNRNVVLQRQVLRSWRAAKSLRSASSPHHARYRALRRSLPHTCPHSHQLRSRIFQSAPEYRRVYTSSCFANHPAERGAMETGGCCERLDKMEGCNE